MYVRKRLYQKCKNKFLIVSEFVFYSKITNLIKKETFESIVNISFSINLSMKTKKFYRRVFCQSFNKWCLMSGQQTPQQIASDGGKREDGKVWEDT